MSQPPAASIYVGDLSTDVSEGLLFEIFKRVGTVSSIRVCRDSVTKRSLGYAYVNFVNYEDARRAIDTLNNTHIKGRPCRIMWSIRDPSSRRSGVGNIFIRNLDESIGNKELHDTFSQFGNIISCKVVTYQSGESKGYGYVHFENSSHAEQAIKIVNEKKMGKNIVYVTPFIPRSERQKRLEQTWTNVYIKNLELSITVEQLTNIFIKFGAINSCVVRKKENIGLAFGFINFVNHSDAMIAVEQMNNTKVGEKVITCCRAQKKAERLAELKKEYEIKRRERIKKFQGMNVYVKNIEDHITEDKLRKEFEQYGNIETLTIMRDNKGVSRGFGFVCYTTPEEAQRAINEIGKNKILQGSSKPLYVALHEPRDVRQQRFSRVRNPKIPQTQMFPNFYPTGYNVQLRSGNTNWTGQNIGSQIGQNQVPPGGYIAQTGVRGGRGRGRGGSQSGQRRLDEGKTEKEILGELLLKQIEEIDPVNAPKITGMIIHSQDYSPESVTEIIKDSDKLNIIVREAKAFLEQQKLEPTKDN